MSALFAYVFSPLCDKLDKIIKRRSISAAVVSVLIILLVVIPFASVVFGLFDEINAGYKIIKEDVSLEEVCAENILCSASQWVKSLISDPANKIFIQENLAKIISYIKDEALSFVFSIPAFFINVLLTFFITFFFLKDGRDIVKRIEELAPLKLSYKKRIFENIKKIVHAVVYGFFIVAIIEGIIMAFTFKIAGISPAVTWGFIVAVLAFVPFFGSGLIWIPAAVIQYYYGEPWQAYIIIAGGLIVSAIDTFIKPKIVGDSAKIHPIMILIGFLGGLKLFGFVGIFLGPLTLSLAIAFFEMYKKEELVLEK